MRQSLPYRLLCFSLNAISSKNLLFHISFCKQFLVLIYWHIPSVSVLVFLLLPMLFLILESSVGRYGRYFKASFIFGYAHCHGDSMVLLQRIQGLNTLLFLVLAVLLVASNLCQDPARLWYVQSQYFHHKNRRWRLGLLRLWHLLGRVSDCSSCLWQFSLCPFWPLESYLGRAIFLINLIFDSTIEIRNFWLEILFLFL